MIDTYWVDDGYIFSEEPVAIGRTSYSKMAYCDDIKDGYLNWHHLDKDPTDLPKKNHEILIQGESKKYLGFYSLIFADQNGRGINEYVIKWAYIPKGE